jgi:hypothetical protein
MRRALLFVPGTSDGARSLPGARTERRVEERPSGSATRPAAETSSASVRCSALFRIAELSITSDTWAVRPCDVVDELLYTQFPSRCCPRTGRG